MYFGLPPAADWCGIRQAALPSVYQSDGLLNDQFMPNAGLKASRWPHLCGHRKRIQCLLSLSDKTNRLAPKVYITGLDDIFNRNVAVGSRNFRRR